MPRRFDRTSSPPRLSCRRTGDRLRYRAGAFSERELVVAVLAPCRKAPAWLCQGHRDSPPQHDAQERQRDDGDPVASAALEQAFRERRITPEIMLAAGGKLAPWFASLTFGGPDLRTCYIGSLRGTRIPFFRAPIAGLPMVHWRER